MGKATKETFESNSCLLSHSMMGAPRDPNAKAAAAAVAHCGGRGLSIRDSRGSSSDGDVEGIELQGPVVIGKGKPLFAKTFPHRGLHFQILKMRMEIYYVLYVTQYVY